MVAPQTRSYSERSLNFTNPTAKLILETMERKKSNLAVSVDVTDKHDLLAIIEAVAPYVCMIKVLCLLNLLLSVCSYVNFPKDPHGHYRKLRLLIDRTTPASFA